MGDTRLQLGSLDYLVLTAILILSIAVSLGRNLSSKWSKKTEEEPRRSPQIEVVTSAKSQNSLKQVVNAGLSNCYAFANVLSLFGLSGEMITHGFGVHFFFLGIVLSLILVMGSGMIPILVGSKIGSLPQYLRKRYSGSSARYLCLLASLIRYICIGALNLHVAGIATNTMTNIHFSMAEVVIVVAAFICSCVGGVQKVPESSISHLWFFILCVITLSTVSVATSFEGGLAKFVSKAASFELFKWPSPLMNPLDRSSVWSSMSLGLIFGLQMFVMSPLSLKEALNLSTGYFYVSLVLSGLVIFLWLFLATWAGVCCFLAFSTDQTVIGRSLDPDGALAKLILRQMGSIKGFRGFFVASLLASSISSMTIRCNQVASLVWGISQDFCKEPNDAKPTAIRTASHRKSLKETLPDDLWKEIQWRDNASRRNRHLTFKAIVGAMRPTAVIWFHSATKALLGF